MSELTFTNSGVSFNTKGVADPTTDLYLFQVSKGKADEQRNVNNEAKTINERCVLQQSNVINSRSERQSTGNQEPHCSRSVDLGLQSSFDGKVSEVKYDTTKSNISNKLIHDNILNCAARDQVKKDNESKTSGAESPQTLQSSNIQSSESHTEPSSRKVDGTLGNKTSSDLQSQLSDPAESEGFFKSNTFSSPIVTPSPADDIHKLQSQREEHKEMDAHSRNFSPDTLQSPLVSDKTMQRNAEVGEILPLQSSDAYTSIHDTAGKPVFTPPLPMPAVSSTFMMKGYKMIEIHKTIKESPKLHKYHQGGIVMVSYIGVKEQTEKDIGV